MVKNLTISPSLSRLRALFLWSWGIGTFSLIAGAATEYFQFHWGVQVMLNVIMPLGVMFVYAVAGKGQDEASGTTDSFADSVYYLGFLLTLVALVMALISMGNSQSGNLDLKLRFGIALLTTIIGLVTRTYYSNFKPSFSDSIQSVEVQMASAATELKDRFHNMSEVLVVSTEAFQASLGRTSIDLKSASASVGSTSTAFAKRIEKSGDKVGAASESVGDKIGTLLTEIDQHVSEAESRIFRSIDRYSQRLEQLVLDPDLLSSKMEPVLDRVELKIGAFADGVELHQAQLSSMADENKSVLEAVKAALQSVENDASKTAQHFSDLGQASDNIRRELDKLTDVVDKMSASIVSQSESATEGADTMSVVAELAQEDLQTIKGLRSEMEVELTRARQAVVEVHTELIEATNFISRELKDD
jgi:hypothetical protein